jgi:hypothetical protein
MRGWLDLLKPTCQNWTDWFMLAACIVFLIVLIALTGCATGNPAMTQAVMAADATSAAQPHPRALLVARVQPACVWWCNVTLSVNNSEGVKAQGTAGDLTTSEALTTTQTVDQSGQFTDSSSNKHSATRGQPGPKAQPQPFDSEGTP